MALFQQIKATELNENLIRMISEDWMLLAAGNEQKHNEMTVSWGGMGFLWNEPVATVYVRPQRYTFEFMETNEMFSLNVLGPESRDILKKAGAITGKGINKTQQLGLTAVSEENTVYFEQARIVLLCQKLYADFLKPEKFTCPQITEPYYEKKDYHKMYIGAIRKVLIKT